MDAASEQKLSGVNPTLAQIVRGIAADVAARGGTLRVVSGLRTYAQQLALWNNRANNSNPVAAPGTSLHERGLAVDLTWSGVSQSYVGSLGEGYGLRWGGRFSKPDPGHFELTSGASSPAPTANGDGASPYPAPVIYGQSGSPGAGANDGAAVAAVLLIAGLIVIRVIRG